MALLTKVGSVEAPIATGTFTISGVGFQGKIVIFWMTRAAGGGFSAENRIAFGAAKSSTERYCVTCATEDAADGLGAISGRRMTQSAIALQTGGGSVVFEADFSSWTTDGFVLNCTTAAPVTGWQIHYMVLGGDDLTHSAIQVQNFPTTTGNQSHTGIGFKPDCLIFATRNQTGIASTTGFSLHIGAMCADGSQGTAGFRDQQVVPSDVATYQRSDKAFAVQNTGTAGVFSFEASFVSMDTDGWTWNATSVPTGNDFIVIALKGGRYKVVADTQKTSTGTKVTSGIGFPSKALLFLSTNRASSTAQDTTIGKLSIGGSDGVGQGAIWVSDTDAANPTDANSYDSSTKAIVLATNTSTLDANASVSAIGNDDFTLNWTTADATAREFIAIAFGSDKQTGFYRRMRMASRR